MTTLPRVTLANVEVVVQRILEGPESNLNEAEVVLALENPDLHQLIRELHARFDAVGPMPRSELINLIATTVYAVLADAAANVSSTP